MVQGRPVLQVAASSHLLASYWNDRVARDRNSLTQSNLKESVWDMTLSDNGVGKRHTIFYSINLLLICIQFQKGRHTAHGTQTPNVIAIEFSRRLIDMKWKHNTIWDLLNAHCVLRRLWRPPTVERRRHIVDGSSSIIINYYGEFINSAALTHCCGFDYVVPLLFVSYFVPSGCFVLRIRFFHIGTYLIHTAHEIEREQKWFRWRDACSNHTATMSVAYLTATATN